jgi:hypothetical protein
MLMVLRLATRRAADFARETAGGLTIFSLFIILMMLMAGGLAVDFMRQETARVRMQSTLDRAILAAADMDQKLDPEAVVRDYFAKANLTGYALQVRVADSANARRVTATAVTRMDPYFLNLVGVTEMTAPAAGVAEESLSDIEISLVLDVSGSMGENGKIGNLKVAAKEFIDTIFAQTAAGRTSVSIVPYSTQVNVGARLLSEFSATTEHASSNCVDFVDADYLRPDIDVRAPLQRTGHFDATTSERAGQRPQTFVCRTTGGTEVLPVGTDTTRLKAKIDSLVATGWTSIDVGVKWGAALLDPAARPAIASMAGSGEVARSMAGRPLAYAETTQKVIVVMTDGINTTQWTLADAFRAGPSGVFRDPADGALSIRTAEPEDRDADGVPGEAYFIPATGLFQDAPLGGDTAVEMSYPDLWANVSVNYHAAQRVRASGDRADFAAWTAGVDSRGNVVPGVYSYVGGTAKDRRLDLICTAAKAAGIRIYSIGFEVTDASAAVMERCATSPSNFYRVGGAGISQAFREIANDIGKLRLTQ